VNEVELHLIASLHAARLPVTTVSGGSLPPLVLLSLGTYVVWIATKGLEG
jgi:hypothetical protein